MKVLHVLSELKFSGAEIMYVNAAPLFKQNNIDLTVVSTGDKLGEYAPAFESAGYNVIHRPLPQNLLSRFLYYTKIAHEIKDNHYDVVHIHRSICRWGMAFCAWRAGARSIYTTHSVFTCKSFMRPWHIWLRWSASCIFKCISTSISDSVYDQELKYFHHKTIKIYNWYSSARFYPAKVPNEKILIREKLGLPPSCPIIISVGGCNGNKRHHDIISAMPLIIEQLPDVHYLHLGQGSTTEEEKQLAKALGINDHIHFYGNQTDVRQYLVASDIYIMTSRFEGISLTTIEAMACRIPAILYDVPGLRDFNRKYETAVIIPESHQNLAESVISLYSDKERMVKLIANGEKYIHQTYSMQSNVLQFIKLYSE